MRSLFKITKVTFPGLFPGLELEVNSVCFSLFGHDFPWYAVIITLGILFCYFYTIHRCKQIGIKEEDVSDFALWMVPSGVIGCRIYYVLSRWDLYKDHPIDVFKIWEGGLGIYGGLILGGVACILVCKHKKIPFSVFGDIVSPSILFAQACGRWGNFFNAEAYGQETDSIFRMGLQGIYDQEMFYVQPTFLYESLWNLTGFLIAHFMYKHKKYDGFILEFIFAWYGFGRMFIELLRSDSLYLFNIEVWYLKKSVLVGLAFFLFCGYRIVYHFIQIKKGKSYPITLPKKEDKQVEAQS